MKKVLVYLISGFILLYADSISFKDLTKMVSKDIKTNVYLDKDIKDYSVDINLVDHQQAGQLYEFYKIVLFSHGLRLQYNKAGDFYYVKQYKKSVEPAVLPPKPLPSPSDQLHYFTYKIRNITNTDVVGCMKIFSDVKFYYLKQSDVIAYSATLEQHKQIKKILLRADNKVSKKSIRLTMFSINRKKLKSIGSQISAFNFSFDSSVGNVLSSLENVSSSRYQLSTSANFSMVLSALQQRNIVNIMQTPVILLSNGVKTSVDSVLNVPYLKTTSVVDSQTNSVTEQYDYKDIGLQINVTPKIKNNWVYLDLDLVSDELISSDDNKPVTQKIAYKSSVMLLPGKPILLTGIKKVSHSLDKSGVPVLSDLPVLGNLFKYKYDTLDNQDLNILIEILDDPTYKHISQKSFSNAMELF